jgi:hypothetical protein
MINDKLENELLQKTKEELIKYAIENDITSVIRNGEINTKEAIIGEILLHYGLDEGRKDMICKESENFCRVFELPNNYPEDFCFNGGVPVTFKMVDWFEPVPLQMQDKTWEEIETKLKEFLRCKVYVKPNRKYILITDFGKSFIFQKEG